MKNRFSFFISQGLTKVYWVKTSITHNRYSTFPFLEDNDPIAAKSAAQILSLKL